MQSKNVVPEKTSCRKKTPEKINSAKEKSRNSKTKVTSRKKRRAGEKISCAKGKNDTPKEKKYTSSI